MSVPPGEPFTFGRAGFIARVRDIVSIPASQADELDDDQIVTVANEIFMTQFVSFKFRSLFRRKITLPVKRFSSTVRGFYLLDESVSIIDIARREERSIPISYNAHGLMGTDFVSETTLITNPTRQEIQTSVHPFFLTVEINNTPQFFDNTNFRFSTESTPPSFTYKEEGNTREGGALVIVSGATEGQEVQISGFERMTTPNVLFDGQHFIFPEDLKKEYGVSSFSVYGTIQPFAQTDQNHLDQWFSTPLFFERLYLLTARQIVSFFLQLEDTALYQKIDARIVDNENHLLAMAREPLDITQRRFHERSPDAKFREQYRRRF